jgi:hypothetical protein
MNAMLKPFLIILILFIYACSGDETISPLDDTSEYVPSFEYFEPSARDLDIALKWCDNYKYPEGIDLLNSNDSSIEISFKRQRTREFEMALSALNILPYPGESRESVKKLITSDIRGPEIVVCRIFVASYLIRIHGFSPKSAYDKAPQYITHKGIKSNYAN